MDRSQFFAVLFAMLIIISVVGMSVHSLAMAGRTTGVFQSREMPGPTATPSPLPTPSPTATPTPVPEPEPPPNPTPTPSNANCKEEMR